jgi:hypothetical protein
VRELYIDDINGDYPGCCSVHVINGFCTTRTKAPVTDDEWFNSLTYQNTVWDKDCNVLEPVALGHVTSFTHASCQTGVFSPKKFAEWLIGQGEDVTEGPTVTNRSRHTITPYFWAPSEKFKRSMKQFCDRLNKNNKEEAKKNADNDRGANAA